MAPLENDTRNHQRLCKVGAEASTNPLMDGTSQPYARPVPMAREPHALSRLFVAKHGPGHAPQIHNGPFAVISPRHHMARIAEHWRRLAVHPLHPVKVLTGGAATFFTPQVWKNTGTRELVTFVGLAVGMTAAGLTRVGVQLTDGMNAHTSGEGIFGRSKTGKAMFGSRAAAAQSGKARHLLVQGIKLEADLDIAGARSLYQEALQLDPTNPFILARVSKTWSDLSFAPGYPLADIPDANRRALEYAEKAIAADPNNSIGHIAACISMGRLALYTPSNKMKVKLAKDAQAAADLALKCNPCDDVAHHVNGRWHYEMAGINCVVRTVIRVMYGTALRDGSYQEAADSYKRAAELAPHRLIHRVELGRCMLKLGNYHVAKTEFEAAMVLNCEDINAHLTKKDAEELLRDVNRRLLSGGGFDKPVLV